MSEIIRNESIFLQLFNWNWNSNLIRFAAISEKKLKLIELDQWAFYSFFSNFFTGFQTM